MTMLGLILLPFALFFQFLFCITSQISGIQFNLRCLDPSVCSLLGHPTIRLLLNDIKKEVPKVNKKCFPLASFVYKFVVKLRQGCFNVYLCAFMVFSGLVNSLHIIILILHLISQCLISLSKSYILQFSLINIPSLTNNLKAFQLLLLILM